MTKATVRWVAIISVLIVIGWYVLGYYSIHYHPDSPRNKIARNRALAARHIPSVLIVLENDKRFLHIRLSPDSGKGGCLLVLGRVESQNALAALKALIAATNPPVHVHWDVEILPSD